jgi:hypothetical protein
MTLPWTTRTVFTGSYRECEQWISARGGSYGPMQRGDPVAFRLDDCGISKWRNLGRDRAHMHGAIIHTGPSVRDGACRVELRTEIEVPRVH